MSRELQDRDPHRRNSSNLPFDPGLSLLSSAMIAREGSRPPYRVPDMQVGLSIELQATRTPSKATCEPGRVGQLERTDERFGMACSTSASSGRHSPTHNHLSLLLRCPRAASAFSPTHRAVLLLSDSAHLYSLSFPTCRKVYTIPSWSGAGCAPVVVLPGCFRRRAAEEDLRIHRLGEFEAEERLRKRARWELLWHSGR